MKRVFCLCVGVTLLGGCASHSWRVDGDTLTLLLDRPGAAQVQDARLPAGPMRAPGDRIGEVAQFDLGCRALANRNEA